MRKPSAFWLLGTLIAFLIPTAAHAVLGTGVSAYGTYWDADEAGYGAGVKLNKSLIDILSIDARGGYLEFDAGEVELIPLEASLNIGLPGAISPYVGIGLGYYLVEAKGEDDLAGQFAQAGLEFTLFGLGAMAELRYMELEESYFDGLSFNAGFVFKF